MMNDFGIKLQTNLEILFLLMILLFFELLEHSFNLVECIFLQNNVIFLNRILTSIKSVFNRIANLIGHVLNGMVTVHLISIYLTIFKSYEYVSLLLKTLLSNSLTFLIY